MSFLSKFFKNKSKSSASQTGLELSDFRDLVTARAKSLGSKAEFQLDPENPGKFSMNSDGDFAGKADLYNAFKEFDVYDDANLDESVHKLATVILQNERDSDDVDKSNIVLVLRSTEYIEAVKAQNDAIISSPLIGELHEFYMVDTPEAMRGLLKSDSNVENLEELRELALVKVKNSLSNIVTDASLEGMTLYYVEDNTFLTSSLILLDEFWESVDDKYQKKCLIALPRKDQLFIFDAEHPQAMQLAEHMVSVTFAEDFNLLTPQIFRRENGQISLVNQTIH